MNHKCYMDYGDMDCQNEYPPCKGEVQRRILWDQVAYPLCDVHYKFMIDVGKSYAEATKDMPTAEDMIKEEPNITGYAKWILFGSN